MIVYHGTESTSFCTFDYKRIGQSNGTAKGFGFYFTSDINLARCYGPHVIQAKWNGSKALSLDKRTITKGQLTRIIAGTNYLENFGEVVYDGYNNVMRRALESLMEDSDVDIIGGIINGTGSVEKVLTLLYGIAKYDSIIEDNVYVALVHSAYQVIDTGGS